MSYTYESNFAKRLHSFVAQKNSLGYPYIDSSRILREFDRFCIKKFPVATDLTKELCLAWAVRKDTEGNNSFRNRLMPIREFAKYLNSIGDTAYVLPPNFAKKGQRHTPYIYSRQEIYSIWSFFDSIKPRNGFPIRHLAMPVYIRILYCCGLRPSEARNLRLQDVDLRKGRFNIMESKAHKSRIVMLADDVTQMCIQYNDTVSQIMPGRELFFPDSNGNVYGKAWLSKPFHKALLSAGIQSPLANAPRLYDFRHTFATHCLYNWMREGKDINAMIPYLSAYMGHAQLSDTYYYIHLVPGLFEQMTGFDISSSENLLPEVEDDE